MCITLYNLLFIQLARETLSFWVKAFSEDTAKRLENFGFIQFRQGGIYLLLHACISKPIVFDKVSSEL